MKRRPTAVAYILGGLPGWLSALALCVLCIFITSPLVWLMFFPILFFSCVGNWFAVKAAYRNDTL